MKLTIPSNKEYSIPQLRMMIREVENIMGREINAGEWSGLLYYPPAFSILLFESLW